MKIKSICIILSVLVMMVYPSAKAAIWNPDTDPNLMFNLNFEQNKAGPPPETNDVGPSKLVGTAYDYNTTDPPFHMWNSQWNGDANAAKIGNFVCDFRKPCDINTSRTYDACVSVPYDTLFDLGGEIYPETPHLSRTFTFWFYPDIQTSTGTLIRHAQVADPNYRWEIRMYDGKLQFWSKMADAGIPLRMETTKTLTDLEVQANSWHHAAIVFDRWTREASLIFIDGLQVDRTVLSYSKIYANVVDLDEITPVTFGTGDYEFEGMLDECRIYHRTLSASEISILYQTDYKNKAIALDPFPNASNVPVDTNLIWYPDPCSTRQSWYFDDDNDPCTDPLHSGINESNDVNSVANASIGGPLGLNTTYYWAVDTNVNGTIYPAVWKFTTETGKAFNPVPANGEEDINVGAVNLQWSASSSASSFDVYFADNFDRVNDVNADALDVNNTDVTDTNTVVNAPVKGETYYWRIVTKFPVETNLPDVASDVWSFRTEPQLIIVNTSDTGAMYNDVNYPAKSLTFVEDSCGVNGYLGDD
ncbi:MAG: LamG domain-containing protein, partial [Sedimentisphaerales bacterium]